LKAGDLIASKYKLTTRIGQGGMGSVWRVTNIATGRDFAIKFLHAAVAGSEDSRSRFLQEARASARVNHPNAIDIFDVGDTEDGSLYLVMELLDGISLADALRSEPPFSVRDLLILLSEACTALHAAHAAGIVHRDLKPANIFLHRDRATGFVVAKVLDFGVSKITNDDGVTTSTGSLLGSPRYMSPEQSISAASADARSDIWSLGVLLFEAFTGRFPHDGDSTNSLIIAIATQPPKLVESVAPQLPLSLRMLVDDCLKPAALRIQSVGTLLDRMLSILATEELMGLTLARPTVARGKLRPRPDGILVRTTPGMIPGLQTSMLKEQGLGDLARYLREQNAAPSPAAAALGLPMQDPSAKPSRATVRLAAFTPPSQPGFGPAPRASYPSSPFGNPQAAQPAVAPSPYGNPQMMPAQQMQWRPPAAPMQQAAYAQQQMPQLPQQMLQQGHPMGAQLAAPTVPFAATGQDPMAESISSINVVGARGASVPPNTTGARSRSGMVAIIAVGAVALLVGGGAILYGALASGRTSASNATATTSDHASSEASPRPTGAETAAATPSVVIVPAPSTVPSAAPSSAPSAAPHVAPTAPVAGPQAPRYPAGGPQKPDPRTQIKNLQTGL
jgi:serine/threonine-protein kinase